MHWKNSENIQLNIPGTDRVGLASHVYCDGYCSIWHLISAFNWTSEPDCIIVDIFS